MSNRNNLEPLTNVFTIGSPVVGLERQSNASGYTPDPSNHDPTNPNATPDNGHLGGLFGGWTCSDWITFHKTLKSAYSKDAANQYWISAWGTQNGLLSSDYSWCKYDSDFANYFKAENVGTGDIFSKIFVAADNIATNAEDTAVGVSKAGMNTATVLKYALPAILILAVVGLGWYGYKHFIEKA